MSMSMDNKCKEALVYLYLLLEYLLLEYQNRFLFSKIIFQILYGCAGKCDN